MKYLLNIVFFSAMLLFLIGCDKEDEQNLLTPETETSMSIADFSSMPENGNKVAVAQRNPEVIFKILDKDQDGKISREEVENAPKKRLAENFDLLDNNKDGFIDKEEVAQLSTMIQKGGKGKRNPEMIFKILDQDQDGKISREEAENAPKKRLAENFDVVDSNKDGFIDKEEVAQLSTMIQKSGKGKRNPEMIFKILDKDQDGKISREEVENAPKKRLAENFDLLDNNKDGFIDKEEVAQLSTMIQKSGKGKRNPEMIFKILDQDQDGKISREEAENVPKKRLAENFDVVDSNEDGFIDKEELRVCLNFYFLRTNVLRT